MNGSVYKRCGTCRRRVADRVCATCPGSTVSWTFVVTVGHDVSGKRMQRRRGGFSTKRDAERALLEVLSSLEQGTFVQDNDLTVAGFLTDEWLPATAPPRTRYETWLDRDRNLRIHVLPHIGPLRLQELNAAHINRMYASMLQEGRIDGAGGLAVGSVSRIHSMLRKALNDAVRWGRLARNPVPLADPPSGKVVRASARKSMSTWSATELATFLEHSRDHVLYPLWCAAAFTGMRRSELLGVRWSDLDLNARTLTVRQTIARTPDGYVPALEQKSAQSARTIHLDKRLTNQLSAHRVDVMRMKRLAEGDWNTADLVFPRHDGVWWNPPAVSLSFRRAVDRAPVPRIRLHDLRHTHATLLLTAGVNPKVVSERLGHSSVAFTLDTYAHVMPGMQPEAAESLTRLVFGTEE